MHKTILQVPVDKQLRISAEKVATQQGFSSLQEIVRVFLTQLASNKVEISLQEQIMLSPKSQKRYEKMTKDFEAGKNTHSAKNVDELLSKINDDQIS